MCMYVPPPIFMNKDIVIVWLWFGVESTVLCLCAAMSIYRINTVYNDTVQAYVQLGVHQNIRLYPRPSKKQKTKKPQNNNKKETYQNKPQTNKYYGGNLNPNIKGHAL